MSDPIIITHEGGVKFAAHIRSHHIVVDQSTRAGSNDEGPSPLELLGMSLGTCIATYVRQFCDARGLSTEGLRVEVEQHDLPIPHRVGHFAVRIMLGQELPEKYMAMLQRVAESCPAHNTLTHGARVMVLIENPCLVA